MALSNIGYGSLASSETLNGNFSYLDDKIDSLDTQVNSSISSILSNIATINSRLTEISESLTSSVSTLQSTISDYKAKTKLLVKNSGMVPNWSSNRTISLTSGTSYTATSNGYIFVIPDVDSQGNITLNGVSMSLQLLVGEADNAARPVAVPVKSGDVVSTNVSIQAAYFVPSAEITVANF